MPDKDPLSLKTAAAAAKSFVDGKPLSKEAFDELHAREMARREAHQRFLAGLEKQLHD